MQLRSTALLGVALATLLVGLDARAVSISFADLDRDTVLTSDHLEFTNFNSFVASPVFDPDDWLLTVIENEDTLRIEHVGGPLMIGPGDLVKFDLLYQVRVIEPGPPIQSLGLELPDDGTATTPTGAVKVKKDLFEDNSLPSFALLEGFDWSCAEGDTECPGRQLQDSIDFADGGLDSLWVRESVTVTALTGTAIFTYVDNPFVVPEPGTAGMLALGLTGLTWMGAGRRPRR